MPPFLDNVFWHALIGPHASFSSGTDSARRYAKGFSPILSFVDPERPDFAALMPYCDPGEQIYCTSWEEAANTSWDMHAETSMLRMVWGGPAPQLTEEPTLIVLRPEHAAQALELAMLTRPGPFGIKTIQLGDYLGYFEGERLVAMAGERACAPGLREISGVCTHPDFQGKGLARRLMMQLIQRELLRGEMPFLHVMCENKGARGLYERMGFRVYKELQARVVSLRA